MVIICIQYIQQDLVFNNNIQFLLSLNDKAIRNIMNKYKITIICLFFITPSLKNANINYSRRQICAILIHFQDK